MESLGSALATEASPLRALWVCVSSPVPAWPAGAAGLVRRKLSALMVARGSADGAQTPLAAAPEVGFTRMTASGCCWVSRHWPVLHRWLGGYTAALVVDRKWRWSPGIGCRRLLRAAEARGPVPARRRGLFARVTSAVTVLPTSRPDSTSSGSVPPEPPAHRVAAGQVHAPGVSNVRQQQLGDVAVRALIPVDAVTLPVLPRVPEVEMQVQHIEAVLTGLSRAVEVGLDHVFP